MQASCVFLGVVALEAAAAAPAPPRASAARDVAAGLADRIADDLARLVPGAAGLDLVLAAALFDPAELLRPGWPVHAALARLAARAPASAAPRLLAFGAAGGRMGDDALEPDPALAGGPLRLLPWLLTGSAEAVGAVAPHLEELLLERGMADAATALALQEAFALPLEHVRHASIHDLCALTAMQYRHAALEGSWSLLESALLHAGAERFSAVDGPPLLLRGDTVWLGTLSQPAVARAHAAGGQAGAPAADAFAYWRMRERQLAAVFAAHGLRVRMHPLEGLEGAEVRLQQAADDAAGGTPAL